jgi:hypothetical protein
MSSAVKLLCCLVTCGALAIVATASKQPTLPIGASLFPRKLWRSVDTLKSWQVSVLQRRRELRME